MFVEKKITPERQIMLPQVEEMDIKVHIRLNDYNYNHTLKNGGQNEKRSRSPSERVISRAPD